MNLTKCLSYGLEIGGIGSIAYGIHNDTAIAIAGCVIYFIGRSSNDIINRDICIDRKKLETLTRQQSQKKELNID